MGKYRAYTYKFDRDRIHTGDQVTSLFGSCNLLATHVQLFDGWAGRGLYNPKPVRTLMETLLAKFIDNAPLSDVYRVATVCDPTLDDKGFKFLRWRLLTLFQEVSYVAAKDMDGFKSIVDEFLGPPCAVTYEQNDMM